MRRVVFDPGVLISAFISKRGTPAGGLDRWRDAEFDLLVSPALLDELQRVLLRRKFRRYATEEDVRTFVWALGREAVVVEDPPPSPGRITEDPHDEYLLALAVAGRADVIVSGDSHLTDLVDPPVRVVSPRTFLDELD